MSLIRFALLGEGFLNIFTLPLLLNPRAVITSMLRDPMTPISPTVITTARVLAGIVVFGITPVLWSCWPNDPSSIQRRRPTYVALGLGELVLIPYFAMEGLSGQTLRSDKAWGMVACLVPLLLWRIYAMYIKPEMMGDRIGKTKRN